MNTFTTTSTMTKSTLLNLLDRCWDESLVPGRVMDSAMELAARYEDVKLSSGMTRAINAMVRRETITASFVGFTTCLGGIVSALVSVPATYVYNTFARVRLAAAIAILSGYDIKDPRVKMGVIASLSDFTIVEKTRIIGDLEENEYLDIVRTRVAENLFNDAGWKMAATLVRGIPLIGGIAASWVDAAAINATAKEAFNIFVASSPFRRRR